MVAKNPCRNCGCNHVDIYIKSRDWGMDTWHYVKCHGCGTTGPWIHRPTYPKANTTEQEASQAAADGWNKVHGPDEEKSKE